MANQEKVRLNKYLSESGICSRREADRLIEEGKVTVNGKTAEPGMKVNDRDHITAEGKPVQGREKKVVLAYYKPVGVTCTERDRHAQVTIKDVLDYPVRVTYAGRLDRDSEGLLLLTNDGDLAEKLTHPSFEKKKIYQVFLDKKFKSSDFKKLIEGIELEDGFIQADSLAYIDEDQSQVGVEIHSGRNRIIRRMFESLGYKVKKLDRVYFAGLTKKNLRRGQWRFLTEQEIAMLKMGSFE